MSYISATLNGQAYTLDNPARVINGNTTIKVTDAQGKDATIYSDKAGTYNVTYTVKATVDGHEFVASKTIKVKVQDSAKESADEVAALIDKIANATDQTAAAKAARTAYDKLTPAAQAKVNNYDKLVAAEKKLAAKEQKEKDRAQAAAVATHLKNANTVEAVEKAVAEFDGLTEAQKKLVDEGTIIGDGVTPVVKDNKVTDYTIDKADAAKNAKAVADSLKVETKDGKANIVGTLPTGVTADKVTAVTYQEQGVKHATLYHDNEINFTSANGWNQGATARTIEVKVTVDGVTATKTVTIPAK
ncbi:MAG: hypothetical protein LKE86_08425 [Eubacterium sp.]|jgi:hypothetical protein|nr:hypothetical protein [Eubacterium sp.]MCH4047432.1 hypothetical protein [Eubacterium sp.]MCH4080515.1 hypothetical protein [Eubacterium sp.]